MPLSIDVRNDIKAAQKLRLPWWGVLIWMAFCLPVVWLCDQFGRLDMALPILNCIAVLSLLIALRWKLRRYVWFWIAVAIIVALHVLLIWYVPWTSRWVPAIAIGAIDSVDFCILLWILAVVGKIVEHPNASER
jgi:hypothetical protein